jgi:hypothetical protein
MTDTYFDRRVDAPLVTALKPGGFADSLVEFGRSGQYCLDLQFRRSPKSLESWATLYAGTTKVLDLRLRERSGLFSLDTHSSYGVKEHHWEDGWRVARKGTTGVATGAGLRGTSKVKCHRHRSPIRLREGGTHPVVTVPLPGGRHGGH